jgi:hypothetical protein
LNIQINIRHKSKRKLDLSFQSMLRALHRTQLLPTDNTVLLQSLLCKNK